MTTPQTAEWLAAFKTRHNLDLAATAGDGSTAGDRAAAAAYAANHVPTKFADALPTAPEVEEWTAAVIRGAQWRGPIVTIDTGPSLLLVGSTGVGKTYQAYGAMRALNLLGIHAKWQVISSADLYARLRPRYGVDSEAEFAAIVDAPVLVVDDLGVEKTSPWVEEVNFRLVNRRYENCRPTLFTSNLSPRDTQDGRPGLRTVLGERVASRLVEMTARVALKGDDRRRAA
jgi:DNA replication protein DnaC